MIKISLTFLVVLAGILTCARIQDEEICPNCISPAFKIAIVDSSGKKINGFTLVATNLIGDTLIGNDSTSYTWMVDSSYQMYGRGGIYRLNITNSSYEPITMDNVNVSSGKCGTNPKILTIVAESKQLSKRRNALYIVLTDSNGVGCGN